MSGRFVKGQSGNPNGRPKKRRPNVSAFDIIFDKKLAVTQGGVERELTVDEALELQTYRDALMGKRMAVKAILKMIEKREVALRKADPAPPRKVNPISVEYDSDTANEAMLLLNIICTNPQFGGTAPRPNVVETWAAQAALSRPGRRKIDGRQRDDLKLFVNEFEKLRWPRGSY